ncbi:hypothetical protein ASD31_22545 [Rhizobium sp. Root482]|nr:hypothetical protein ASD31_22545 [Rhizobium sp. Root482]
MKVSRFWSRCALEGYLANLDLQSCFSAATTIRESQGDVIFFPVHRFSTPQPFSFENDQA